MQQYRRRTTSLWVMLAAAAIYAALIIEFGALSTNILLDGAIGVSLGLYICSHPASAAIDLFYLDRLAFQRLASDWGDVAWVSLNLLVMVAGCVVTVVGATRFVG
jgi:hypothetical protein